MKHRHESYMGFITLGVFFLFLLIIAQPNKQEENFNIPNEIVACTMDAKQCPDGSYVGRVGPFCEFQECPPLAHEMENMKTSSDAAEDHNDHSTGVHKIGESYLPIYDAAVHTARPENLVIITYTESGFNPESVIVKKGTTVEFINKSNKSFWPASDNHPTHEIYPEFDAKNEIAPGGKYFFVFDKVGKWGYHNHLDREDEGVIEVQ